MADPRDDRVSAAYRELPDEGPSPALDSAIQAAARRAVGSRPGSTRRWQVPVSIAAVLALAIGVSLQVDREKPVGVDEAAPASAGNAEYPVPQAATEPEVPAAAPVAKRSVSDANVPASPPAAKATPLREEPASPAAAPQAAPRAKSELAREATTQEKRMEDALDTPERRLERIAGLRARGLHDEADRELAELRRAFPDYRISEEWLGKVQRK